MGQHDACGTTPCNHVSDTIAFASMLVFASVMPPLGPDAADTGARSGHTRADAPDAIAPNPVKKPAARSPKRFDS